MQQRVRIYLAMAAALWAGTFALDIGIKLLSDPARIFRYGPYTAAHVCGALLLPALWRFTCHGTPSVNLLAALELGATVLQATLLSIMFSRVPAEFRPDIVTLLAVTHVLVLRAAIVPGTPLQSFAVGALGVTPPLAFGVARHLRAAHLPDQAPPAVLIGNVVTWAVLAVATSTVIAAVIYGLRERVRAAMELGQYTLLAKLGEGGMGVVYRARHALLRRPTAVKVLPPERAGQTSTARFEKEVQLTAGISHPNVVSVYDYGRSSEGAFYYAMELLDGIDLQELIESDGPQPPARVLHILVQAADALAEAHAVGLIHRDIKPANLVLTTHERHHDHLKVVDFGLVKEISQGKPSATEDDAVVGTPLYMSPESITSASTLDGRSDLYALGAVAYFLLTGAPPFEARSVVEVCALHLHGVVTPPSERSPQPIPAQLEALVLECLAKDKSARPASAEALLARLRALDDVPPWTAEDARACWQRHPRTDVTRSPKVLGTSSTLVVSPHWSD